MADTNITERHRRAFEALTTSRCEIRAEPRPRRGAMNNTVVEALLARLRRRMAGAVADTTGRLRGRGRGRLRPHNAPEPVRRGGSVNGDRQRGDRRHSV